MEMSRQRGNVWDPKIVAAWLQVEQHMEDGGAKVRAVVGRVTALRVASPIWHTSRSPGAEMKLTFESDGGD